MDVNAKLMLVYEARRLQREMWWPKALIVCRQISSKSYSRNNQNSYHKLEKSPIPQEVRGKDDSKVSRMLTMLPFADVPKLNYDALSTVSKLSGGCTWSR